MAGTRYGTDQYGSTIVIGTIYGVKTTTRIRHDRLYIPHETNTNSESNNSLPQGFIVLMDTLNWRVYRSDVSYFLTPAGLAMIPHTMARQR